MVGSNSVTSLNPPTKGTMKATPTTSLFFPLLLASCIPLSAADHTWTGGGNGNFNGAANWNPTGAIPNNGTADLIFSGGTQTSPNAQAAYSINTLRFASTTAAFTIGGARITLFQDSGQAPFIRNDASHTHLISNPLQFDHAGTISASAGSLTVGEVSVTTSGHNLTLSAGNGHSLLVGQGIAGAGNLISAGAGTVRINGSVTSTGALVLNSGTLEVGASITGLSGLGISNGTLRLLSANRIPNGVGLVMQGGTLDLAGFEETIGSLSGSGGTIQMGTNGDLTIQQSSTAAFSGSIIGAGSSNSFTKAGSGSLDLSGTMNYAGSTTISSGTLRVMTASALPGNTRVTVNSGATFDVMGITGSVRSLAGGGNVFLGTGNLSAGGAGDVFSGTMSGLGSFSKIGSGTMEISTGQQHSGGTHVGGGILVARHSQALGNGGSTIISSGATLRLHRGINVNRPGGITFSGQGFGSEGAIHVASAGSSGATRLAGPAALAGDATIQHNSGFLFNFGAASGAETLEIGSHALTLTGDSESSSIRFAYKLSGNGLLRKSSLGIAYLSGDNSGYTGAVELENGTLEIESNAAFPGGSGTITTSADTAIIQRNGIAVNTDRALHLGGALVGYGITSWSGSQHITLGPSASIRAEAGSTFTIDTPGAFTGTNLHAFAGTNATLDIKRSFSMTGSLTKSGRGTLLVSSAAVSSYGGATTITEGTLRMAVNHRLPDSTPVSISTGALFDLDVHDERIGSLAGNGDVRIQGGTLTLIPPADALHSGRIYGNGDIVIEGGVGTQIFSTANTYFGNMRVSNSGKLTITAAGALDSTGSLSITNGGEVKIGAVGQTVASLYGNGTLTHMAAGGVLRVTSNSNIPLWNGLIQGPGGLVKSGDGYWQFDQAQTYTGPTTIEAGDLAAAGLPSSAITIAAGASLRGHISGSYGNIDCSGTISRISSATITAGAVTLRAGNTIRLSMTLASLDTPPLLIADTLNYQGGNLSLSSSSTPIDLEPGEVRVLKVVRTTSGITGDISGMQVIRYGTIGSFTGTVVPRVSADGKDLEVVITAPINDATYGEWIANFNVGDKDGFTDDPDNDGIPNGVEYVLGGHPGMSDADVIGPVVTHTGTHLEVTYWRTHRSIHLDTAVWHSTDLGLTDPWQRAVHGQNGVTISGIDGNLTASKQAVRIPVGADPRRFARVQVDEMD